MGLENKRTIEVNRFSNHRREFLMLLFMHLFFLLLFVFHPQAVRFCDFNILECRLLISYLLLYALLEYCFHWIVEIFLFTLLMRFTVKRWSKWDRELYTSTAAHMECSSTFSQMYGLRFNEAHDNEGFYRWSVCPFNYSNSYKTIFKLLRNFKGSKRENSLKASLKRKV